MQFRQQFDSTKNVFSRSFIYKDALVHFSPGIFDTDWVLRVGRTPFLSTSVAVYLEYRFGVQEVGLNYPGSTYTIDEVRTHIDNLSTALELIELKETLVPFLESAEKKYIESYQRYESLSK